MNANYKYRFKAKMSKWQLAITTTHIHTTDATDQFDIYMKAASQWTDQSTTGKHNTYIAIIYKPTAKQAVQTTKVQQVLQ